MCSKLLVCTRPRLMRQDLHRTGHCSFNGLCIQGWYAYAGAQT